MSRFPVVFDTTAIDELLESKPWYANHLESLGEDFEREVEQTLDKIVQYPKLYPVAAKTIRKAVLKRFPFVILYAFQQDKVIVLHIFHSHRNPDTWKKPT